MKDTNCCITLVMWYLERHKLLYHLTPESLLKAQVTLVHQYSGLLKDTGCFVTLVKWVLEKHSCCITFVSSGIMKDTLTLVHWDCERQVAISHEPCFMSRICLCSNKCIGSMVVISAWILASCHSVCFLLGIIWLCLLSLSESQPHLFLPCCFWFVCC